MLMLPLSFRRMLHQAVVEIVDEENQGGEE